MEKVQLILQLLHPYTFIPTSTVIRETRMYYSASWFNILISAQVLLLEEATFIPYKEPQKKMKAHIFAKQKAQLEKLKKSYK